MKIGMPILYEYDKVIDNINLCKKLNLDFIELNFNFDYFVNELQTNKLLSKQFKENGIEATVHFYDDADFASIDEVVEGYIKNFKKHLKSLKNLNIKLVNVHLNLGPVCTISGVKNYMYEKNYNAYINKLITNLKKFEKLVNKINAKLVLENVITNKLICNTYKDLKKHFNFNLDCGHDYMYSSILSNDILDDTYNILEYHIHDSDGTKDHLSLGLGKIDFKKFIGSDAYYLIEVKSSEDLQKSVEVFRNLSK